MENPTIKDVASLANVSIATVSRILNNQTGYSEETKQKVLKVIQEIGYHPDGVARGLVSKRTNTIAVLLPEFTSSFSLKVLQGIEESTHAHNYSMIVCNTGALGNRTLDYVDVLREKKVDGLIYTSSYLSAEDYAELKRLKIPIILLATIAKELSLPYVKVDDRQAAYDATCYLIEKGHQKIVMMGGSKRDQIAGFPRYQGYKDALSAYGLSADERFMVEGDFSFHSGKSSMYQVLKDDLDFTAIFAASDDMALGAMSVAFEKQLKIPKDFSIIGYDNSQIAEMSTPPLSTVAQPLTKMGEVAMAKLIEMIQAETFTADHLIMNHYIIERETVREIT